MRPCDAFFRQSQLANVTLCRMFDTKVVTWIKAKLLQTEHKWTNSGGIWAKTPWTLSLKKCMQNLIGKISTTALKHRCIVIHEFKRNECRLYAAITGIYFNRWLIPRLNWSPKNKSHENGWSVMRQDNLVTSMMMIMIYIYWLLLLLSLRNVSHNKEINSLPV